MTFTDVPAVGAHFRGEHAKAVVQTLLPGDLLELEREPDNQYDPNAIKVVLRGEHLAYVARDVASFIAPEMDAGLPVVSVTVTGSVVAKGAIHPLMTIELGEVIGLSVTTVMTVAELAAAMLEASNDDIIEVPPYDPHPHQE